MSFWVALAGTVLIQLYVLRRLRFDWSIVAIVLSGTLLCANYLTYTGFDERNWDAPEQLRYIQTIAEHQKLPDVYDCTPCGHPPLYYGLGALWSRGIGLTHGWMSPEQGLQWLSLQLFFGFVVFALLIFQSCVSRLATLRLAAAMLVFWPSSIINSVRVHNDSLASLLMVVVIYFVARWDKMENRRDFYGALAASALALLTKASGFTVAGVLLLFALFRLKKNGFQPSDIKQLAAAVLILGSVAILSLGLRESKMPTSLCQKVLGHACDGRYVPPEPDSPHRFLSFDIKSFVWEIDVDPNAPFLNHLAKSSLLGMTPLGDEFTSHRFEVLASAMSVLLLALLAICLAGLPLLVRREHFQKYRVYVVVVVVMFLCLVAFRVRAPNELHEDFRHIFPVLVPFCLAYAVVVERFGRRARILYYAGVAPLLLLVVSSVLFFVH